MQPREAGKVGAAISGLADTSGDIANTGLALQGHIREAQASVDELAAQNELAAADEAYQVQLAKTTNSRDVEGVTQEHNDTLNEISRKWSNSPASREIQMHTEALRPRGEHLGQIKQIDLMSKEWDAQTEIQMQTLIPQLVTAQRNGDKGQVDYINGYIDHLYDDGKQKGLISDADKDLAINKMQIQVRQQLNDAVISSADPKERLAAIQQLKSGGSGPLNLAGLAAGDVAALRTQAESMNERLDNLAEAQNLNRDLNIVQNAFAAPEYKNNYEARVNSLQDGDWLVQHGIVSEDGSPNREMAQKLIQETNAQRAEWEKQQTDRDQKALDQYGPNVSKMTRAQIEQLPGESEGGISPRARATLLSRWDENYHIGLSERTAARIANIQERQEKMEEIKFNSDQTRGQVSLDMASGKVLTQSDIWEIPGITNDDRQKLLDQQKAGNKYVNDVLTGFKDLPLPAEEQNRLATVFYDQVQAGDLRGPAITTLGESLKNQAKQRNAAQWIDSLFYGTPTATDVSRNADRVGQLADYLKTKNAPARPKTVPDDYVWNPQGNNGKGSWRAPKQ
jgi:hypothetical protein